MQNEETPEATPAPPRRRIIRQPLRTKAPVALITGETPLLEELEARLKRSYSVITFPSFTHFLAEPPGREPWKAIVVARGGAWDARFEDYVPQTGSIALFGLAEEPYGWPEDVARVQDVAGLEPWLERVEAPPPVEKKVRVKREPRRKKATVLSELAAGLFKKKSAPPSAPSDPGGPSAPRPSQVPAPAPQDAPTLARPEARRSATAGKKGRPPLPATRKAPDRAREPRQAVRAQQRVSDLARDREFVSIAGELGLLRAFELIEELRAHARGVGGSSR